VRRQCCLVDHERTLGGYNVIFVSDSAVSIQHKQVGVAVQNDVVVGLLLDLLQLVEREVQERVLDVFNRGVEARLPVPAGKSRELSLTPGLFRLNFPSTIARLTESLESRSAVYGLCGRGFMKET
jgi:hypothetical protein